VKAMAILLGLLALTSSGLAQEGTTLTVAGEGAVTVPADVVIVSVSITVEDENVTLASLLACEGLNRTIEALIEAGVNRDDVSAGRGRSVSKIQSTSRICDNSSCVAVADEAVTLVKEEVTIRFDPRNEDLINRSFEAATSQGAEAAISWYALEEKEEAFTEARKKAVEDAEEEARALAAAAGLRLGERLEIYEPSPPTVVQDSGAVDLFDIAMMDLFDLSWPWSLDPFEKESPPQAGMLEVRSMVMVTYRVYP
jgi:uncharacterized protein YggE